MKTRHLVALIVLVCATPLSSHPALAQFSQQGPKLVGTGAVGSAYQGNSVSISADGNTAIVGGGGDNSGAGAAWVWTRSGGVWTQQGTKLVGSGAMGNASQGGSVAISGDGNTVIIGGYGDNSNAGAAWVWTRSGGVWTQQGTKLVGSGAVGSAGQGRSVSLSADGNTAIVGGPSDSGGGAAWVWTRSGGAWTQQGTKLVGSGAVGNANQGSSVSLSADGNTTIVGGPFDNGQAGAAWVWTRSGGVWTQQGTKLVGSGAVGNPAQGISVSLSADGDIAIVGGPVDNYWTGAAWVWTRSGGVWTQQGTKLVVPYGAYQGISVSLSADSHTAIVGGWGDNSHAGEAWVWARSGGVWTQQGTKLVGSDAVGVGGPGSVSLSGDSNTAIIGGPGDNNSTGAAWIFAASAPVSLATVSHVLVSQRPGTTLVDLFYDLSGAGSGYSVAVALSSDGGASFTVPATHFSGDGVTSPATPGTSRHIVWDAGADFPSQFSTRMRFQITVSATAAPAGMALIPAGSFTMGNCMDPAEGFSDELPQHTVYVSAFCMEKYLVTKALWDEVYQWATNRGYSSFVGAGFAKAANHPAQSTWWNDTVKWCNARSQKAGLTPCYYSDAELTVVYKAGQVAPYVKWNANGYRLPTEAEWEKAARGGLSGKRFPWGDTITHNLANYYSTNFYIYDISSTRGLHPSFNDGATPYTSPPGYFAPNGYGLSDMAGNVSEWCWDYYNSSYYGSSPNSDPRGPASGGLRVLRGGDWSQYSNRTRCAFRSYFAYPPYGAGVPGGIRCVRQPIPGGFALAASRLFTLDTRSVSRGSIFGQVFGSGVALANAQVRVLDTPYITNSGVGGGFNMTNIPAGIGYVVAVAAPGFASTNIANVSVTASPSSLGVVTLRPLGAHKVIPLVPDLNPAVSKVEEGGVAYRYYRVVSADGNTPAGGVTLQARLPGGAVIPQTGDIADNWPGRVAGVSDADGIVRMRIPAADLPGPGFSATLEVIDSGTVSQTFTAQVVARQYAQVWKKRWHGVAGVGLHVVSAGLGFGHETLVTRRFGAASSCKEVIGHWREEVYKAGVSVGKSVHVNRIGGGGGGQAQGRTTIGLGQSFHFDPQTADPLDNVMKFYAAYADALNFVPFGGIIIEGVQQEIMNLGAPVVASEAALRVTGMGEAEAGIGGLSPLPGDVPIHFRAVGSGELEVELGVEHRPSQYVDRYLEFGIGWARDVQWKLGPQDVPTAMFQDRESSLRATVRRSADEGRATALIMNSTVAVRADTPRTVGGWLTDDLVQLRNQEVAEYKSTCTLGVPSLSGALPIALNAWQAVNDTGQGAVFRSGNAVEMISSLLSAGQTLAYEKSAYSAAATVSSVLPNFDVVLSLDSSAEDEKGAEIIKEAGVIWKNRVLGLEAYTDQPRDYYPTESLSDLQGTWMASARAPLDRFLNKAGATIVGGAVTVIRAGTGAALWVGQGVMNGGSWVVTKWVPSLFGAGGGSGLRMPGFAQPVAPDANPRNLAYGIGGIYRFESTNSFSGTGTLTIAYDPAEVVGLNPGELRMYYLPAGTNRWRLVGGVVDSVSNTVTAVITNLGTFAVAPPMPSGDVNLRASNFDLVANGTNELVLVATDLRLNTGGVATNAWLFTVDATGIELLDADLSTNWTGVQLASSNGVLRVRLRAPVGGTYASVSVSSVAGDARGRVGINLIDAVPPVAPANVLASAGQSRVWVSWQTNREPDIAGYRVYYRAGSAGPPWDGTAAVEGAESPVSVTGTNCLLRGLALGTNYYVSVTAVDTTGNESLLSTAISVTTSQQAPHPPTSVAARFGEDGTNVLMWTLSEDDGYNDRDVIRYEVWRVVIPGTNWLQVSEVAAGIGLFSETNLAVGATEYVRYAVVAVDQVGASSARLLANRFVTGTASEDNDGDGMADDWELANGLNPNDPSDALLDSDGDGVSNFAEYRAGTSPTDPLSYLRIQSLVVGGISGVQVVWGSSINRLYTVQRASVLGLGFGNVAEHVLSTPPQNIYLDTTATNANSFFYRIKVE